MKSAREIVHGVTAAEGRCVFGKKPGNTHGVICNAITAAIEARDRELVEACAKEAEETCWGDCKHTVESTAVRIRALIPKEDSRG